MWAGRFKKALDSRVNDFNSSISFDCRMYREDITGSMAHAAMLGRQGIISKEDSAAIIEGLRGILSDLDSGALAFDFEAEDIHMFVESVLTSRIGDAGKRLHTARSRNDQVALDIRMYLRSQIDEIISLILRLLEVIYEKASSHIGTVMAGYTHLQRAQPVTYAHYILAYAEMLMRDIGRLRDTRRRMNVLPLGSCALAGTTYPLDREWVAAELGFDGITCNSIDGVSDRDFVLELASALSVIMVHMSRFSEEIILWCSSEFGFIELDDAFSTGSSIMPQKKNPDIAELVRGKAGRVSGDLTALLTMMKGLPLAYNKDMQEDKEAIFDAVDNVKLCLEVFSEMLRTLTVRADRLRASASMGFINATDCADWLVGKGIPFRDAYRITGTLVGICVDAGRPLEALTLEEFRAVSTVFDESVYEALDLDACVARRNVPGGPAPGSVRVQLAQLESFIKEQRAQMSV